MEDALSCAAAGVAARVEAVLGAGRLARVEARRGEEIVWFGDGDTAGAATAGVDALLLQGGVVRVVETPLGLDPNALLQSAGTASLRSLVEGAMPAALSLAGETTRLAQLDPVDYDAAPRGSATAFHSLSLNDRGTAACDPAQS